MKTRGIEESRTRGRRNEETKKRRIIKKLVAVILQRAFFIVIRYHVKSFDATHYGAEHKGFEAMQHTYCTFTIWYFAGGGVGSCG